MHVQRQCLYIDSKNYYKNFSNLYKWLANSRCSHRYWSAAPHTLCAVSVLSPWEVHSVRYGYLFVIMTLINVIAQVEELNNSFRYKLRTANCINGFENVRLTSMRMDIGVNMLRMHLLALRQTTMSNQSLFSSWFLTLYPPSCPKAVVCAPCPGDWPVGRTKCAETCTQ